MSDRSEELRLHEFQEEDVQKAVRTNTLIASECGVGKTIEAIETVRRLREKGEKGPTLVLCLKRAKAQWAREIRRWDPGVPTFITGVAGRWPEEPWQGCEVKDIFEPRMNCWVIAHHEALSVPKSIQKRGRRYNPVAEWKQYMWEAVIVDEGHRFKNRKSARSFWLRKLETAYKMVLTGTPIERNPADAWALLNWLYPRKFQGYWKFFDEFVEWEHPYGAPPRVRVARGMKSGKESVFAQLIGPFTIRRTKAEVREDMPPNIETVVDVYVDKDEPQWKAYERVLFAKDILVPWEDLSDGKLDAQLVLNGLSKIVKLQQALADPEILGVGGASAKMEWVKDWVADNPDESVIVFTKFRKTAEKLAKELDAALIIGGEEREVSEKDRRIVSTIKAGGTSLDLPWIENAIFVTSEWSTIEMNQAKDRIHRITIDTPRQTMYLRVPNTVDDLVMQALEFKWSQQELVYEFLRKELGNV